MKDWRRDLEILLEKAKLIMGDEEEISASDTESSEDEQDNHEFYSYDRLNCYISLIDGPRPDLGETRCIYSD